MNKTAAAKTAKQTARYGYHEKSSTEGYLFCPNCRQPITEYKLAWEKWTTQLTDKLTEHLIEEH